MKIYVVTPSYNQLDWLKLCIASVRDQVAPEAQRSEIGTQRSVDSSPSFYPRTSGSEAPLRVHHHIQDACSTDGTVEFLQKFDAEVRRQQSEVSSDLRPSAVAEAMADRPTSDVCPAYTFSYSSERDAGMYDAINRGWERAPEDADIIAHLNCDEQYLPGALQKISDCFMKHPKDDVVFADMIVTDKAGGYLCHRRPLPPRPIHARLFIPGFTCTTFQRRSVFFEKGCRFDTSWKNLGDMIWYLSLIEKKCRFYMLNEYTSLFADTGDNLNLQASGREERRRYYAMIPSWMKLIRPGAFLHKRIRYAVRMFFSKTPESYNLYLPGRGTRVERRIEHPTCVWKTRKQWRHAMIRKEP